MKKWTFLLSLVFLLQACGGDNDSVQRTIRGAAFVSGPVQGASVAVSILDGAGKTVIAETTTSDSGRWSVEVPGDLEGVFLVEASGGTYQELAGGDTVSLLDSQRLKAISWLASDESGTMNLSPFSTLAEALYHYKRGVSAGPHEAVLYGNSQISRFIGFNVLNTTPSAQATSLNNASRFYHLLFGLSSVADWIARVNGGAPGRTIDLTVSGYNDVERDGWFNGHGSSGDIFLGSVATSAETYRHLLALNTLNVASQTPVSFSQVESYAKAINDADLYQFKLSKVVPLDLTSPVLFNLSLQDGQIISGLTTLSFAVVSRADLLGCDLLVDGIFHATSPGGYAPEYLIDTELLSDGEHSFAIECMDVTGGAGEKAVNLVVANAGTEISSVQPSDGQTIGGSFTFSASVTDPAGIQSVRFDINGTSYFPGSLSFPSVAINTAQFPDQDRSYSLDITVVNQVGDTTTETVSFTLDNVDPTASWNLSGVSAISGDYEVSGQIADNQSGVTGRLLIDGNVISTFQEGSFSQIIPTNTYTDGNYQVTLEVVDQAGNSVILAEELIFDNTPPTLELINPLDGDVLTSDTLMAALYADTGGIDGAFTWLVDGVRYSQSGSDGNGRVTTELNVSNYSRGPHTVGISVTDRVGNTTTETVNVVFDY
jgi:hypothetical protein